MRRFTLALMAVVLALWSRAMLSFPFGRDQGILAWVGSVVLRGGMPYRDAWEVKGPMAILPFTLVQFLFGHNMWGIRVFDLAMLTMAGVSAAFICLKWFGRDAAIYAVFVLLFTASSLDFWMSAQPDGWCGYLLTFTVALLISRWRWSALVGAVCIGLCTLQKPLYVVYLALFLPALVGEWRGSRQPPWKVCVAICCGFGLPIGACLLWFAWRGALHPFVDTFIGFNLAVHVHADELSGGAQFRALVNAMRSNLPFSVCMPLAVGGGVVLLRRDGRAGGLYVLWLALGFLLVIVQRKYLLYHWFPAMCAVAVGSGLAMAELRQFRWTIWPRRGTTIGAGSVILLWLAFVFLPTPALHGLDWLLYVSGHWPEQRYARGFVFVNEDYFSFARVREVARFVRAHTAATDRVLVWGFDPLINYLSGRDTVGRFGYDYPLLAGNGDAYEIRYRQEFLGALTANPPAYIAVAEKDGNILVPESSDLAMRRFPDFAHFVSEGYRLETQIGDWELWRRK